MLMVECICLDKEIKLFNNKFLKQIKKKGIKCQKM